MGSCGGLFFLLFPVIVLSHLSLAQFSTIYLPLSKRLLFPPFPRDFFLAFRILYHSNALYLLHRAL